MLAGRFLIREKDSVFMSLKYSDVFVWVILAFLTVWNIRINVKLVKLRSSVTLRDPQNLSANKVEQIKALNKERRKWNVLSQILFWVSLILVIVAQSMGILVYFLDLYTLACIVSNKIELQKAGLLKNN